VQSPWPRPVAELVESRPWRQLPGLEPIYSGVGTRVIDAARLAASNQGSLSPALRSQDARLNARSELE
jgi:hypothetical protein